MFISSSCEMGTRLLTAAPLSVVVPGLPKFSSHTLPASSTVSCTCLSSTSGSRITTSHCSPRPTARLLVMGILPPSAPFFFW